MRKKLSISQVGVVLISALLPLLDGMFQWTTYTMFTNLSKKEMSLQNLMTVQRIGGGPFLYWMFYITLAIMLIYCIYDLFCEDKFIGKKSTIVIPVASLLFGVIMIMTASNHSDTFIWNGETRYVSVSLGVLAYVEIVSLVSVTIIECYKQVKIKRETR